MSFELLDFKSRCVRVGPVSASLTTKLPRSRNSSSAKCLADMGLVCSGNNHLAGVSRAAIENLMVDHFVSEAFAFRDMLSQVNSRTPSSRGVSNCFRQINAGVWQLSLFEFINEKYWQPSALFLALVSYYSAVRSERWSYFLQQVEEAAKLAQCRLSGDRLQAKDVKLQKFSFCLLVTLAQTGCPQQVNNNLNLI